jgi:hypothetical protein
VKLDLGLGLGPAVSGGGAAALLSLSASTVDDNAAAGTVIGTFSYPEGYTLELEDTSDDMFALDGDNLTVGATALTPGWAIPSVRASHSPPGVDGWAEGTEPLRLHPVITINAVASPADLPEASATLTHAWTFDDLSRITLDTDGTSILTVTGAWGTTNDLTGTYCSGGTPSARRPQLVTGVGPGGKALALFESGARSRFTFPSAAAALRTVFVVISPSIITPQFATLASTNGQNHLSTIANAGAGEQWIEQWAIKAANGVSTTSTPPATTGYCDIRGVRVVELTLDGTNQIVAVDGIAAAGVANTAQITLNCFGGTGTPVSQSGSQHYAGYVSAILIYSGVLSANDKAYVLRCLAPYRSRDFFFSVDGDDANTGWSPTAPKADPELLFNSGGTTDLYYNARGDRIRFKSGDRFQLGELSIRNSSTSGNRAWFANYDPATGLPITDACKTDASKYAILSSSTKITGGWTDTGADNKWTQDTGVDPSGVAIKLADGHYRIMAEVTGTTSDFTWEYAAPTLTIRTAAGVDPNSLEVESGFSSSMLDFGTNYTWMTGLAALGTGGNEAFRCRSSNGGFKVMAGLCGRGDLMSMGSSPFKALDLYVDDWGAGVYTTAITSTSHDVLTCHGATTYIGGATARHCWNHFLAHQVHSQVTMVDLDCQAAGVPYYVPAATGSQGNQSLTESRLIRAEGASLDDVVTIVADGDTNLTITDSALVGLGSTRGVGVRTSGTTPAPTLTGNTVSGLTAETN